MKVIKFGGTSIGTVERFINVVNIIKNKCEEDKIIVVLSAIGGITDELINAVYYASEKNNNYLKIAEKIKSVHFDFLNKLIREPIKEQIITVIEKIITELFIKLQGLYQKNNVSPKDKDSIISLGEYLSNNLLVGALKSIGLEAKFFDSKNFIRTDSTFGEANVNFHLTNKLIAESFRDIDRTIIPVVNGFVGSDEQGNVTTLGRSGSDYTAAIIGAALKADIVEIWTDVNGVLSADPKIVENTFPIKELDYNEVAEIASFGAKVIFPKSMEPLQKQNIPMVILNSFNPKDKGTVVRNKSSESSDIRVVTSMKNLSLVMLEKQNSKESLGILIRLLKILSKHKLTYLLNGGTILQQSMGIHHFVVSFITSSLTVEKLIKEVQNEFEYELKSSIISKIRVLNNVAIISVFVGNKYRHSTNIRRIFETLSNNKIKVHLFFHRSSIEDISLVVDQKNEEAAINLIHNELFFEEIKKLEANVA
ncbi:aspartate kinase [Melioribacteraceae bacterium 4301-Me]|uniref:aspartate kinase n=1 Tax=Pyranulibacter aquaticus TaxID=3163344 RepID=UPI003598F579